MVWPEATSFFNSNRNAQNERGIRCGFGEGSSHHPLSRMYEAALVEVSQEGRS